MTRWKTSAESIWCSISSAATSGSGPQAWFEPEEHWCPSSGRPRHGPSTAWRSTSLSSPIVPNWVRSSSGCVTDDCGRTSAISRPSMMPSPPSTRPSDARGRRSFAFVRDVVKDDRSTVCQIQVMRARYYAVGTTRLLELLEEAGFEEVKRVDGADFQPVLVGTRKK